MTAALTGRQFDTIVAAVAVAILLLWQVAAWWWELRPARRDDLMDVADAVFGPDMERIP